MFPLLFLIFTLGFLMVLGSVSAAPGDVIYVNGTGGNDDFDGYTWDKAKKTILNATGNVNENGVVNIANGEYSGNGNTQIIINRTMTINGVSQAGTIINGTGTNWIFRIEANINLNINNLTFTNATNNMAGAIANNGGLTLNNCTFNSNNASSISGAISNYGTMTGTMTNFNDNTASNGGAISNYGSMTLNYCNFNNNIANNYAGAVFSPGFSTFNYCNFNGNQAFDGGALYNSGNIASMGVSFCNFTDNSASWNGGAIYNSGVLGISNTTFSGNSAMGGGGADVYNALTSTITSSTFTSKPNTAGVSIYNDQGDLTVHFCRMVAKTTPDVLVNGGSADLENNWWGTNFTGTNPVTMGRVTGTTVNHWIVLSLHANPGTVNYGGSSIITADFQHDQDGNYLDPSLGHIPDDVALVLQTDHGSIGSKITTKLTRQGMIQAVFTASEAVNQALIMVIIDDQTLSTGVNINSPPATADAAVQEKTIAMQSTGLPMVSLILALIMVMGGFYQTHRKQ